MPHATRAITIALLGLLLLVGAGSANADPSTNTPTMVKQSASLDPQRVADLSTNFTRQYKQADTMARQCVQKLKASSNATDQLHCLRAVGHLFKASALMQQSFGILGLQSLDVSAIGAGINHAADSLVTNVKSDRDSAIQFLLEDSENTVKMVEIELQAALDEMSKVP